MGEIQYSKYQQDIFSWVVNGRGDAVVQAVAGSGKTFTLVEAAKLLRSNKAIFLAFNKHIATELQTRLGKSMVAKTIHSVGMGCVKSNLNRVTVDESKYHDLAKSYAQEIANNLKHDYQSKLRHWAKYDKDERSEPEEPPSAGKVLSQLKSLAHFCRVTLTPPDKFDLVEDMVAHFGCLDNGLTLEQLHYALMGVIKEGDRMAERQGVIDYDDMLWLPWKWDLYPSKCDWLMIDEAQDLSAAQLDLVLKMRSRGGRMLFCGDSRQAIFGFAGATCDSIDQIIKRTNATVLPLSICYRCPKSHIELAKEIVPSIEAAPGAEEGTVEYLLLDKVSTIIAEGDLVIARCTAPVIKLCIELIAKRIPARVRGRDIGKSLTAIVTEVAERPDFEFSKFGIFLQAYQQDKIYKLLQKKGSESQIESLRDRCSGIWICYQAFNAQSVSQLCDEIEALFSDGRSSVMLSTVHRCVAPDTFVETPTGLLPISTIKSHGEIATPSGIKKYTQRFDIDKGRVLKITTKSGYSITVTPDHGLTSFVRDKWQRVKANDLKIGDWLRLKLGATVDVQSNVVLPNPSIPYHNAKQYTFPSDLNEELAELLGLIVADGTIYRKGIRLAKQDKDVVERFKLLMELQFKVKAHDVPYGRHGNAYAAEVNSVQIADWLLSIGGLSPKDKLIPSCILQSQLKVQAAFLRGLFEDAGINSKDNYIDHICLHNYNPHLTQTVQTMLLRFGIISSVTCRKSQNFQGALYIFGYYAQKFGELIGFVSERKNNQLFAGFYGEERMYSVPLSKAIVSKLTPFLSEASARNAYYRGFLSRQTVKKAILEYGGELEQELLGWHSERITSIKVCESETICVEVPDGSRFLQNGFDGWNSKGLENDRVFILEPEKLPLIWKNQKEWQLGQEYCLKYVALTRAKKALFFITDSSPTEMPELEDYVMDDEEDIYF